MNQLNVFRFLSPIVLLFYSSTFAEAATEASYRMDPLFSNQTLLVLASSYILLLVVILGLIRDSDTGKSTVVITGLLLIATSVFGLWFIETLSADLDFFLKKEFVSEAVANKFKLQTHYFLYLVPFISAAIGSNLISDTITKDLHYQSKTDLSEGACTLFKGAAAIFMTIAALPVLLVMLIIYLVKKFLHAASETAKEKKRPIILTFLKLDILLRNHIEENNTTYSAAKSLGISLIIMLLPVCLVWFSLQVSFTDIAPLFVGINLFVFDYWMGASIFSYLFGFASMLIVYLLPSSENIDSKTVNKVRLLQLTISTMQALVGAIYLLIN
ncbi:hypothetical protein [Mariprofundus sp. KV]|uniref:hypothetical protein n=1 Tax=Mariprofundus sp. KV TaxID=2608715 RepID=UPI0015A2C9C5|nr:hypothetical protein [Mariprofundus sp. KV]NWF36669.1 hypothetical protein [Mariprofundus sp. KV]